MDQYSNAVKSLAVAGSPATGLISDLATSIKEGQFAPSTAYLPNFDLLESGSTSPSANVGAGYQVAPAPMGIGDFGIGGGATGTAYAYNTSHFLGSITLNSANATYPGAYYFMGPESDGYYNTPYEFGIQLNTVVSNISIPGSNTSVWWTQNVVALNGQYLTFEDNVWNFSDASGFLYPGSLYSYNGTPVYDEFYYDYGPSIQYTFPVTINLYNNASIVNERDQVTFGYSVTTDGKTYHGVYDTVVFNNPWAAPAMGDLSPPNQPGFQVNGKTLTPIGLNFDSELIYGGPGGGTNADFNELNATETLSYSNESSGGWQSVPSAYDFGTDTGETSIGIAETWNPGDVVDANDGPSFLYGLWNSETPTAVPSGSIHVAGTISPSYGFVMAINDAGYYTNITLFPSSISGAFSTYLPPGRGYYLLGAADGYEPIESGEITATTTGITLNLPEAATLTYAPLYIDGNAQAQAAASVLDDWTGGALTFDNSFEWGNFALLFDHVNDWGYVEFNLFQATDVTDAIVVNDVFQGTNNITSTYGTSDGSNMYITDVPLPGSTPCLLCGGAGSDTYPVNTWSLPDYGSEIAFYADGSVTINDETAIGYFGGQSISSGVVPLYNLDEQGGAEILWATPNAVASEDAAAYGSYGVYAMGSNGLQFSEGLGIFGANAVSVVDSAGAVVNEVTGVASISWANNEGDYIYLSFGAYDFASPGGTYTNLSGIYAGVGFADFYGDGATATIVSSQFDSFDYWGYDNISADSVWFYGTAVTLAGAEHTTITDVNAYGDSVGVTDGFEGPGSLGTTINGLYSEDDSVGFYLEGSDWTNLTNVYIGYNDDGLIAGGLVITGNTTLTDTYVDDTEYGLELEDVDNTTFDGLYVFDASEGVFGEFAWTTTFDNVGIDFVEDGVILEAAWDTTVENENATLIYDLGGFYFEYAFGLTLVDDVAWGSTAVYAQYGYQITGSGLYSYGALGFIFDDGSGAVVSNVVADDNSLGVLFNDGFSGVTGKDVAANGDSTAVEFEDDYTADATVTDGNAGYESVAVEGVDSSGVSVVDVAAIGFTAAPVAFFGSYLSSATDIAVTDQSVGAWVFESDYISISDVTATDLSIGVWSYDSESTSVDGVTATNATLSELNAITIMVFGYCSPGITAVLTEYDELDSISNVVATTYPVAYYDVDSYDQGVNNLNATGDWYGVILDDTYYSTFTGLGMFHDFIGVYGYDDVSYNVIFDSSFVDSTSYAIAWYDGYYNLVYLNDFLANNGAGSTYSAAHIQVYSGYGGYNYWDGSEIGLYEGNYWSDWHTYNTNGDLAPYPIGDGNWDYYPIGGPEGTVAVYFYAYDLASGTTWTVTLGSSTESTANDWLVFYVLPGSYSFSAGAVAGYTVAPGTGTVSAIGTSVDLYLTYTAQYTVTVTETGLPAGSSWEAIVGGTPVTGTTSSLTVTVGGGENDYQVVSLTAGYSASPASGSIYVTGPYTLATTFAAVTYAVTVSESGLASGQVWSATVNGVTQYSTGTTITFYLANGTQTITVNEVKGYSVSNTTLTVVVNGAATATGVTFSSSSSPALVSQSTFNTWLTVALIIAVIALVAAILAILMRGKGGSSANAPPQQWSGPSSGSSAPAGASGGEQGAWSEGAGPGTPPPPSS